MRAEDTSFYRPPWKTERSDCTDASTHPRLRVIRATTHRQRAPLFRFLHSLGLDARADTNLVVRAPAQRACRFHVRHQEESVVAAVGPSLRQRLPASVCCDSAQPRRPHCKNQNRSSHVTPTCDIDTATTQTTSAISRAQTRNT